MFNFDSLLSFQAPLHTYSVILKVKTLFIAAFSANWCTNESHKSREYINIHFHIKACENVS